MAKEVEALAEKAGGKEELAAILATVDKVGGVEALQEVLATMEVK